MVATVATTASGYRLPLAVRYQRLDVTCRSAACLSCKLVQSNRVRSIRQEFGSLPRRLTRAACPETSGCHGRFREGHAALKRATTSLAAAASESTGFPTFGPSPLHARQSWNTRHAATTLTETWHRGRKLKVRARARARVGCPPTPCSGCLLKPGGARCATNMVLQVTGRRSSRVDACAPGAARAGCQSHRGFCVQKNARGGCRAHSVQCKDSQSCPVPRCFPP